MQNSLKLSILLIDDDEDDYVVTRSVLAEISREHIQVDWVSNYDDAKAQLAQQKHDVYLVDYRLGIHTGLDILREANAQDCRAPIILLTGHGDHEIDLAAMAAGAADYLLKDHLDAVTLERTIRYAVEHHRTMTKLRQALQEKTKLAAAIDNVSTGIVITDPNQPDNPVIFVNPAFTAMTGYRPEDIYGKNCRLLQGPESDPATVKAIRTALRHRRPIACTLLNYRKDGNPFWSDLVINPVFDENGHLIHYVGMQTDVTDRKRSEAALRDSEERYALAMRGANDGIWDWNLKTNEVYFSPRWKEMLGYDPLEVGNTLEDWFNRIHPDDLHWFKSRMTAHLEGLTSHLEHEHRILHKDGGYRWVLTRGVAVRDAAGHPTRMAGSQTDITTRKQTEEQLLHDAFHDALTGLPNRTLLMDRLRHAVHLAQRNTHYQFAVLFLDLDRFKMINDSLGHAMGDCLLMAIAQRLTSCIRPGDTIARLGGDEFVILLEDIKDTANVTAIADRVRQELLHPFHIEGHDIFTSASIGIALSEIGYEWSEDLIRDADTAMYRAKAQGRSRYEIFNTNMHTRAVTLLQIETDLRRALARQEISLAYQPIINLKTGHVGGFEALLRWHHPDKGSVPPSEFIPIAEETGLIVSIGDWIVREACEQMHRWQRQFPHTADWTISVNLSGKQFTPDLVQMIRATLQDTQLNPRCLKLEITESVLMDNPESAATLLAQMRDMGIPLSMDDFGTGYSSLSYLHRFPIDTLKIDRSFINKIDSDGETLAIVRTIVALAWNLGMDVVAEGVETQKQLSQLRALQCDYGQGHLFSPPLTAAAMATFITEQIQGLACLNNVHS